MFFFLSHHCESLMLGFITILDLLLFFVKPHDLHRRGKLYWFQLLVSELDFSIKLHLHRGPAKNNSAYVPPLRFQFADFHFILHTEVSYIISQPCPKFFQGVKDFSIPIGLDAKVKVDLVVVGSVAVSEKGSCSYFHTFGYIHGNFFISHSINLHFLTVNKRILF